MVIPDVGVLSDDDCPDQAVAVVPSAPGGQVVPRLKRKRSSTDLAAVDFRLADLRSKLRRTVDSKCACASRSRHRGRESCFVAFQEPSRFHELHSLRKTLLTLAKEDADRKVICQNQKHCPRNF